MVRESHRATPVNVIDRCTVASLGQHLHAGILEIPAPKTQHREVDARLTLALAADFYSALQALARQP